MPARLPIKVCHLCRRVWRDAAGVAAVEFAYIVPFILLILVGTAEVSRAISIDRRFGQVTAMVADLVGREDNLTAADVNAIYDIVSQVMSPFDASSLKISIVPVMANPSDANETRIYARITNRPSYQGGTLYACRATYELTDGLIAAGASVIVVETQYSFQPMFLGYLLTGQTWTDKAMVSPRNSCVDFDDDNCTWKANC